MKKIFTLIAAIMLAATSAMAQFELGGIVGGIYGASAKYWFTDEIALQGDLGVGLTQAAMQGGSIGLFDFTINPNALYHFDLPVDNLKFYTGGGVSFGLCAPLAYASGVMGKFGVNAVAGVSYDLQQYPITFAFDFRPGYGLAFAQGGTTSYFDWKLGLAVRYRF